MRLQGKTALITGAASGIGAACVRRFIAEGARVVASDLDPAGLRRLGPNLGPTLGPDGGPGLVHAAVLDVTDEAAVNAHVDAALARLGHIDILVNSAGITARHIAEGTPWSVAWQRVMDVNVKGTLLPSVAVMTAQRRQGRGGAIVNLSSIYGQVARPALLNTGPDPYTHSKATVVQMTRDLAVSGAADAIRVNCLCPGFIRTPMTATLRAVDGMEATLVALHPLGRLGEAEEVANCALFLASDEASFVTGVALPVDGGYLAV